MSQAAAILVPEAGPKNPVQMAQAINDSIRAIISQHSGAARPAYVVAGMQWVKNDAALWQVFTYDGANDVLIGTIDPTSHAFQVTLRALEPEVDVASAAMADLGAANSAVVRITGATQISSFGPGKNMIRLVRFAGALTLKNGAALALPGAADIATVAGDTATVLSDNAGNWRVATYQRANGSIVSAKAVTASLDRISNVRGTLFTRGATDLIGIPPGTAGLPLLSGGPGAEPYYGAVPNFRAPDLWVQDERPAGTSGDASSTSAGVFVPATLNTVKRNVIAGASVASNLITLPIGTYYAKWKNPLHGHASSAQGSSQQKTRLRDTTNNVTLGIGGGNSIASGSPDILATLLSTGTAIFTLSAPSIIALHRVSPTHASTTFGVAMGYSEIEVYAVLEIWKVG